MVLFVSEVFPNSPWSFNVLVSKWLIIHNILSNFSWIRMQNMFKPVQPHYRPTCKTIT